MNSLTTYLKRFFQATDKTYIINYPAADVIKHIRSIPYWLGFWSTEDLELQYFKLNEFLIHTFNFPWTKGTSSRLYGVITESQDKTTIKIKIKGSYGAYLGLVIFLVIGISFTTKFIREPNTGDLFASILFIIALPVFAIWLKQYSDAVMNKRFKKYLSKKFKVIEM